MTLDDLDEALQNLAGAVLRLHEVRQAMVSRDLSTRLQELKTCKHHTLSFDDPGVRCVTCGKTFGPQTPATVPCQPTQQEYAEKLAHARRESLQQYPGVSGCAEPGKQVSMPAASQIMDEAKPRDYGSFRPSRRCPMTMDGKHVPEKVALDGTLRCERCYVGIHAE